MPFRQREDTRGSPAGCSGRASVGAEFGDGFVFPLHGDGVVALGGPDRFVVHEFGQHVKGRSGVGVPLRVGVAEGVGVDE